MTLISPKDWRHSDGDVLELMIGADIHGSIEANQPVRIEVPSVDAGSGVAVAQHRRPRRRRSPRRRPRPSARRPIGRLGRRGAEAKLSRHSRWSPTPPRLAPSVAGAEQTAGEPPLAAGAKAGGAQTVK